MNVQKQKQQEHLFNTTSSVSRCVPAFYREHSALKKIIQKVCVVTIHHLLSLGVGLFTLKNISSLAKRKKKQP